VPNTWNVGQTGKKTRTYNVDVERTITFTVQVTADTDTDAARQAIEAETPENAKVTNQATDIREAGW
jgi:hypothetical protein